MNPTPFASLLFAAAIASIATPALACENDSHCKGDRVCTKGPCVEPPARVGAGVSPVAAPPPAAAAQPARQQPAPGAPPEASAPPGAMAPPLGYGPAPAGQVWYPGAPPPPPGAWAMPAPPATRRRVGLMVAGIVLGGVGVFGLGIGGAVVASSSAAPSVCGTYAYTSRYPSSCPSASSSGAFEFGAAVMVLSGAMLAAGIPMTIVGARKVPVDRNASASRGPTLEIRPERGGVGVGGTF